MGCFSVSLSVVGVLLMFAGFCMTMYGFIHKPFWTEERAWGCDFCLEDREAVLKSTKNCRIVGPAFLGVGLFLLIFGICKGMSSAKKTCKQCQPITIVSGTTSYVHGTYPQSTYPQSTYPQSTYPQSTGSLYPPPQHLYQTQPPMDTTFAPYPPPTATNVPFQPIIEQNPPSSQYPPMQYPAGYQAVPVDKQLPASAPPSYEETLITLPK